MKNRFIVFAALFIILTFVGLLAYGSHGEAADTSGLRKVTLGIEGMT